MHRHILFGLLIAYVFLTGMSQGAAPLKNIVYGEAGGEKLLLDIGLPEGPGPFPAAILVHGGGWSRGDKEGGPNRNAFMAPMHEPLLRAGIAWFSINYRLAPRHRFPAPVEDVETAIRWVKAHAAEYRVDARRLALSGESAGAHLIAMTAVRAKDASTRVAALVPFYGPFDFVSRVTPGQPIGETMAGLLGHGMADEAGLRALREASPLFFVRAGLPPFLLVHGTSDGRVPYAQSVEMQKALRKVGVLCELLTIEGGDHGMAGWSKRGLKYQEQVVAWLRGQLAVAKP